MKVVNIITGDITTAMLINNDEGKKYKVSGRILSVKSFDSEYMQAHDLQCRNPNHKRLIMATDCPRCLSCGRKVAL